MTLAWPSIAPIPSASMAHMALTVMPATVT
jgi:hypothetical protein